MRLFELVDSDQQVLAIIKPILLRAKAEGAEVVSMSQLLNDMDSEDNITAELMVDLFSRHRKDLEDIIVSATLDSIQLNKGPAKTMTTRVDKDAAKMKSTALKQAMDQLK
jgi:hypothetical protein